MSALRKPSGKWFYRVTYRHPDGRSERISGTPAINTKQAAQDAERAHIDRLLHPAPVVLPPAPKFAEFAERWLATYPASAGVKPSTVKNYEYHIRMHLLPALGPAYIDDISTLMVSELFAVLSAKSICRATIHNVGMTLRTILSSAKDWGLITTIPTFPKERPQVVDFDFYSPEETSRLLFPLTGKDRTLLLFALRTGARQGEQIALRWDDVDFVRGLIRIRRSYKDGITSAPKNGKERTVPMSNELREALTLLKGKAKGLLVFYRDAECTKPFEPWHMTAVLERAQRLSGVKELRWHDLRHTFASQAMQAGVKIAQVQEWLGHATITMTMRYAHTSRNDDQVSAISALDEVVKDTVAMFKGVGITVSATPAQQSTGVSN
jgi:integrase